MAENFVIVRDDLMFLGYDEQNHYWFWSTDAYLIPENRLADSIEQAKSGAKFTVVKVVSIS